MIGKNILEAETIMKNRIKNRYYWIDIEALNFENNQIEFNYSGMKAMGKLRKNHSIFRNKKGIDCSLWKQSKILRNKKIQDMNQKEMIEEWIDDFDSPYQNSCFWDDQDNWQWYQKNWKSFFDDLEWFPSRPA